MPEDLHKVCEVLDKLTLDCLTLMEEEIQLKLFIENAMCAGETHLAKTRYILGQNSVSALQLPSECGEEFQSSVTVVPKVDDTYFQAKLMDLELNNESSQDPIKWFGYLVPQNLHYAQKMFSQALQWVVQAANVQLKLNETCTKINQLKALKNDLSK